MWLFVCVFSFFLCIRSLTFRRKNGRWRWASVPLRSWLRCYTWVDLLHSTHPLDPPWKRTISLMHGKVTYSRISPFLSFTKAWRSPAAAEGCTHKIEFCEKCCILGKSRKKLVKIQQESSKNLKNLQKFANFCKKSAKISAIFNEKIESRERCKGVHCVDLGESFPTSIYL